MTKYKKMSQEQDTMTLQKKFNMTQVIIAQVNSELDSGLERVSNLLVWKTSSRELEDINEREYENMKKVKQLSSETSLEQKANYRGLELNLQTKSYFLFSVPTSTEGWFQDNSKMIYLMSMDNQKTLFKVKLKDSSPIHSSRSFLYAESLNLIVIKCYSEIMLYRLNRQGFKMIAQITVSYEPIKDMCILEPDNILAIQLPNSMMIMDLITRKVSLKYELQSPAEEEEEEDIHKDTIRKITYVKRLKLVAIVFSNKIRVYRIQTGGTMLKTHYTIPLEFSNFITGVYTIDNIIIAQSLIKN